MELDDDEEDYQKELEAKKNAQKLLRLLTEEESQIVKDAVHSICPPSNTMAQINNDIAVRELMNQLQPHLRGDSANEIDSLILSRKEKNGAKITGIIVDIKTRVKSCYYYDTSTTTVLLMLMMVVSDETIQFFFDQNVRIGSFIPTP